MFILDESGSVGQSDFTKTLNAVNKTIDGLAIDSGNIRVGVMCFSRSTNQRAIFHLNGYVMDKAGAMQATLAIQYLGGGTYIRAAMNFVRTQMFLASEGRLCLAFPAEYCSPPVTIKWTINVIDCLIVG